MHGVIQTGHPRFATGARAFGMSGQFQVGAAVPTGVALLRPAYGIGAGVAVGTAYAAGGIEVATFTIAALIALWAFAQPRTSLWLAAAFMVYLFVFFQREAPLGEELPEEFFFWGTGLALITAGLVAAALFSSQVDWPLVKRRLASPVSMAMLLMLIVVLAATIYGLLAGNDSFAVARQCFGCVLFPVYYLLGLLLFRAVGDIGHWLRRVSWCVALGSLWYTAKLSVASAALGSYYREQSPLATYAGAVAVVALNEVWQQKKWTARIFSGLQCAFCLLAILLMGNRAALGGVVVAGGLLVIVAARRRGLAAMIAMALLVCAVVAGASYYGNHLLERRGLIGEIAQRFLITPSKDHSYQGRTAQMDVVMNTVHSRPVLGAGMGSYSVFFAPGIEGRLQVTSVDNGWGFVMLKMGLLGVATFTMLLVLLIREASRCLAAARGRLRTNSLGLLGLLFYSLVTFWGGPLFFHFTEVALIGAALAGIVVLAEARTSATSALGDFMRPASTASARGNA